MTLEDLGYNDTIDQYIYSLRLEEYTIGRITHEHKDRYVIKTQDNNFQAELIGNLRYAASSRRDLPAVGDWVAFIEYDIDKAIIHKVLPRFSLIERQAVGKTGQVQIIATNIDYGLIVQAVDRDFNLNRLERYLTICNTSQVKPLIVLNKVDLINDNELKTIINQISNRIQDVDIIPVNHEERGYDSLQEIIKKGKTYCLLGSSGVGKSTILNALCGTSKMKTGIISDAVNKGKHTTSHRELIVLESGGIIIDNPGMREVGIADFSDGLESTFDTIISFSKNCKFKDCSHTQEKGCAVLEAIENGELDPSAYSNFLKMKKEQVHYESDALERKRNDKAFGKMIKNYKKHRKDLKY